MKPPEEQTQTLHLEGDRSRERESNGVWPKLWSQFGRVRSQGGVAALLGATVRYWEIAAYGSLLMTAAVMRFWNLGSRAMHHDESLHSYYSWRLSEGMGYQHDPMMHGPFQFEANAAIFFIFGDNELTARVLYAFAGVLLVALPSLFRARLGRIAALTVATLLAFSPVMFYFSRFARNDILTTLWTFGLVICMWRYIDEGRNRFLYVGAVLLAMFFATKETAFIVVAILVMYLIGSLVARRWAVFFRVARTDNVPIGTAVWRVIGVIRAYASRGVRLSRLSRHSTFLLILGTLSLPQGAALMSVFQDTVLLRWANITLARTVDMGGPIGAPVGGGLVIAGAVVVVLLAVSCRIGHLWKWSIWWRCSTLFYLVWVLLYSTFFTNLAGIRTGWWQSLGYWVAQQEVARGDQPWYYYLILAPIYEFLPLAFTFGATIYYIKTPDRFGRFLVYWVLASFALYTLASEKMPWLLMGISLSMVVLTGKFLVDIIRPVHWSRLVSGGGLFIVPGVPVLLWVLWQLAFSGVGPNEAINVFRVVALAVVALSAVAGGVMIAHRVGIRDFAAFATVPAVIVLLVLTVRTGAIAAYQNGDRPVEMLVYTQSSPDLPRILGKIKNVAETTKAGLDVPIIIDSTSGFAWPWAWYLRDYSRVGYPPFETSSPDLAPDSSVIVVHGKNQPVFVPLLEEAYKEGVRIRHRWWFPEHTYRDTTFTQFLASFADRDSWRRAMDYFLHRRLTGELGSEDAYVYIDSDLPQEIEEISD